MFFSHLSLRSLAPSVAALAFLSHAAIASEDDDSTNSDHSELNEVIQSCWDSTFAYNSYVLEQSGSHYYITLSGSTLTGSTPVSSNNGKKFYSN